MVTDSPRAIDIGSAKELKEVHLMSLECVTQTNDAGGGDDGCGAFRGDGSGGAGGEAVADC